MIKRKAVSLLFALLIPSSIALASCPPEGDGGDTILNRLKNRETAPSVYTDITVDQFLNEFTPNLNAPKYRSKFSKDQNTYVKPREQKSIALIGYILGAKQSGPESCNCHDPERRDFHVWIGAKKPGTKEEATAMRAESVVVEPTPAGQEGHNNWRLRTLKKLASQGAKVRISGWAMYDPEHPDQLKKTRGTLWEVHPIFKIEVWNKGAWQEL